MTDDLAACIVDAIIDDLTDRKGLRHEWDNIDENVQDEIRTTWISIVKGKDAA